MSRLEKRLCCKLKAFVRSKFEHKAFNKTLYCDKL